MSEEEKVVEDPKPTLADLEAATKDAGQESEQKTDVLEAISSEALTKVIDDKLVRLKQVDFLTISMSKTGALVGVGLLLVLIWLLPVINVGLVRISGGQYSLANLRSDALFGLTTPSATPMPDKEQPPTLIRIKTNHDSLQKINAVEQRLRSAGFENIETVYDDQLTHEGILIAARADAKQIRQQLLDLLQSDYAISSESATLTDDSDFAVAILVSDQANIEVIDSEQ